MRTQGTFLSIFFTVVLSVLSFCTFAQQVNTKPAHISAVQAGTISIDNEVTTIELSSDVLKQLDLPIANPSYYVVFTSQTEGASFTLVNKGDHSFSVKANRTGVKADYVVFLKSSAPLLGANAISTPAYK